MAALWRRLAARNDIVLLAHAAGAGPRSASVEELLRHWIARLSVEARSHAGPAAGGPAASDDRDAAELRTAFAQLLEEVATDRLVVLLVDAVDQFGDSIDARQLSWLPEPLPVNVRLVASGQPGGAMGRLASSPDVAVVELAPLTQDELARLATDLARRHRRVLPRETVEALVADRGQGPPSPLWTQLAVEELLVLERDAYREASVEGAADEQLAARLTATAAALPPGPLALYDRQFDQARQIHGELADHLLAALVAAPSGLRDADIEPVLTGLSGGTPPVPLALAQLRRRLRGSLTRRADGRLDFAHAQAREAATRRVPSELVADAHRVIADHLETLPSDDPVRADGLLHHVLRAGRVDRVAALYVEPAGAQPTLVVVDNLVADPVATAETLLGGLAASPADVTRPFAERLLSEVLPDASRRVDHLTLRSLADGIGERVPELRTRAHLASARLALHDRDAVTAIDLLQGPAEDLGSRDALEPDVALLVTEGLTLIAEAQRQLVVPPGDIQQQVHAALETADQALTANPGHVELTEAVARAALGVADEALGSVEGDRPAPPDLVLDRADEQIHALGGHPASDELSGRSAVLRSELLRRQGRNRDALATLRDGAARLARAEVAQPGATDLAAVRADAKVRESALLLELGLVDEARSALDHAERLVRRLGASGPTPAPSGGEGTRWLADLELAVERQRWRLGEATNDDSVLVAGLRGCHERARQATTSGVAAAGELETTGVIARRVAAAHAWREQDKIARTGDLPLLSAGLGGLAIVVGWYIAALALGLVNGAERLLRWAGWWDDSAVDEPIDLWSLLQGQDSEIGTEATTTIITARISEWVHSNLWRLPGIAAWVVPGIVLAYGLIGAARLRSMFRSHLRAARWTGFPSFWLGRLPTRWLVAVLALIGLPLVAMVGLAGAGVGWIEHLFRRHVWATVPPLVTTGLVVGVAAAVVVVILVIAREFRRLDRREAAEMHHLDTLPGSASWRIDTSPDSPWRLDAGSSRVELEHALHPARSVNVGDAVWSEYQDAVDAGGYGLEGSQDQLSRLEALAWVQDLVRQARVAVDLRLNPEAAAALDTATDVMARAGVVVGDDFTDLDWAVCALEVATLRLLLARSFAALDPEADPDVVPAERETCLASLRSLTALGGESTTALRAVADAVDAIEATRGEDELWDDADELARFGVSVSAEHHVPMEVATAQVELVLASLHALHGRRGSSFRLSTAARRRLLRLRRRGVLVPPRVLHRAQRTGSAPAQMHYVYGPISLLRYGLAYVADLARTAWGFRTEAAPFAAAVLILMATTQGYAWLFGSAGTADEAIGMLRFLAIAYGLALVAIAAFTLCWLTPDRRHRARQRRRGARTQPEP